MTIKPDAGAEEMRRFLFKALSMLADTNPQITPVDFMELTDSAWWIRNESGELFRVTIEAMPNPPESEHHGL